MACGCAKRKRQTNTERAVTAAAQTHHEVFVDGASTGRKFTTLLAAERYATRRGGEVRAVR